MTRLVDRLRSNLRIPLLWWDSFGRMSERQRRFWVRNRLVGRLGIPRPSSAAFTTLSSGDDCVRQRIETFQRHASLLLPLRDPLGSSETDLPLTYLKHLKEIFDPRLPLHDSMSLVSRHWLSDDGSEEHHCFQRFHLYAEALGRRHDRGTALCHLMSCWMRNAHRMPPSARDPFTRALRLINWGFLLPWLDPQDAQAISLWPAIEVVMARELGSLSNNIEYELGGNHILVELFAVWLAAHVVPPGSWSRELGLRAQKELRLEIAQQFSGDCFHSEHCTHYHLQSVLACLIWASGLKVLGRPADPGTLRILREATRVIRRFVLADGRLAALGDKCYSFFTAGTSDDLRLNAELGSELFGSSATHDGAESYSERAGPYYIHRSSTTQLIVDIGNIGFDGNPGHGHSDLLSFIYCRGASPVFIDPGTRTYDSSEESLKYKRARMHSTLTVDEEDQALLWARYRWGYLPEHLSWTATQTGDQLDLKGAYCGFRHLGGLTHQREFQANAERLVIRDSVWGKGEHTLEFNFVIHPLWSIRVDQDTVFLHATSGVLMMTFQSGVRPEIACERENIFFEYQTPVAGSRVSVRYPHSILPFDVCTTVRTPI